MYILSVCSILYLQMKDGHTYQSNIELCHSCYMYIEVLIMVDTKRLSVAIDREDTISSQSCLTKN